MRAFSIPTKIDLVARAALAEQLSLNTTRTPSERTFREDEPASRAWEDALSRQHAAWAGADADPPTVLSPHRPPSGWAEGAPPRTPGDSPRRLAALVSERHAAVADEQEVHALQRLADVRGEGHRRGVHGVVHRLLAASSLGAHGAPRTAAEPADLRTQQLGAAVRQPVVATWMLPPCRRLGSVPNTLL